MHIGHEPGTGLSGVLEEDLALGYGVNLLNLSNIPSRVNGSMVQLHHLSNLNQKDIQKSKRTMIRPMTIPMCSIPK